MQINDSVSTLLRGKSPSVHSISPAATVFEAIKMMDEHNIGALPVLQGGQLVGMFSEREYTRKVMLKGRTSRETQVGEIMMRDVVSVSTDDSVSRCMEIMTESRVRHLPVVEDERLIGILSIGDVVKWIISAQTATIEHLTRYVFGEQDS